MQLANSSNNWHYNKKLQPLAKKLRAKMTKAEACLWKYVLSGRTIEFQFRRQRPVLNYIVDFMCKDLMLIIEVDGMTHEDEEVFAKDEIRQKKLESAGFTVLRFNDEEVLKDIENVEAEIVAFIERCNSTP